MLKVVSRTKTNAITFGAFVMTCSTRGSSSADRRLVEETNDLAGNVLAAGLLVVHDTGGGGQDDVTELTRGKELDNPLLHVAELDVVAGEMTPVLLRRPLSWTTILPLRWSSTSSNSPM